MEVPKENDPEESVIRGPSTAPRQKSLRFYVAGIYGFKAISDMNPVLRPGPSLPVSRKPERRPIKGMGQVHLHGES